MTCYIATGGAHLPVSVAIGGLVLRLGSWGSSEPPVAPAGAITLPTGPPTDARPVPAGGLNGPPRHAVDPGASGDGRRSESEL